MAAQPMEKPPMATKPQPKGEMEAALGEQFRTVRRRQKVWLRDLAEKLGCSVNTIRWHEAGARMMRADMLAQAAEIMGVQPQELVQTTKD